MKATGRRETRKKAELRAAGAFERDDDGRWE